MAILVELSGEQLDLASEEAASAASVLAGREAKVLVREGPALVLDAPDDVARELASRLGLAHHVCCQAVSGPLDEAAGLAASVDIGDAATFRVRARRTDLADRELDHKAIVRDAGRMIEERSGATVDLVRPETEVRLMLARNAFAGRLVASVERSSMEARSVRHRPYSMPVSIHPKLARAMVNLTRVPPGGSIFDPFVGTGGIAIEAALMGYDVSGSDFDPRMVDGSRENLAAMGLEARLEVADVRTLDPRAWDHVDAVVTDPPYGRSTRVEGHGPTEVLDGLYRVACGALLPGGRLVVCLPSVDMLPGGGRGLEVVSVHPIRVHRSLTRHICVLSR